MKHDTDNGGPAFPQNDLSAYNMGPEGIGNGMGMTLRDWFAGQALAGLMASSTTDNWVLPDIAREALGAADAMIAEIAARRSGRQ